MANVEIEKVKEVMVVTINRPEIKNAVDDATAHALAEAFRTFERDDSAKVAILRGAGGTFCAGADLGALARGELNRLMPDGDGPMGPSRMHLAKPVIAAIDGYAVAGGLELALWCDLRVMEESATLGVFCRRFGVPLVDGGTIRLPRTIGVGRALDLILTGRAVGADEALAMGLVSRVVPDGTATQASMALGREIASFPEVCMLEDRQSTYESLDLDFERALLGEFHHGLRSVAAGTVPGAKNFVTGQGRHGQFAQGAQDSP